VQLAVEDRADPVVECAGGRLAVPFADYWRPTAANYWGRVKKAHVLAIARAILGDRWARDHADDKKATLAAALETAFDRAKNTACIGLDQVARDGAAAWLPPGMAYGDTAADGAEADPELDGASDSETDPRDSETDDVDAASSVLPAFLTEDGPSHDGLNGAAAV
jgi:ParB family transcriptional regulator, chromosome partitioning protein